MEGGECESRVVDPESRFIGRWWIGEGGCGISHHNMWGFGRARQGGVPVGEEKTPSQKIKMQKVMQDAEQECLDQCVT